MEPPQYVLENASSRPVAKGWSPEVILMVLSADIGVLLFNRLCIHCGRQVQSCKWSRSACLDNQRSSPQISGLAKVLQCGLIAI